MEKVRSLESSSSARLTSQLCVAYTELKGVSGGTDKVSSISCYYDLKKKKPSTTNIAAIWQLGILSWLEVSFRTNCQGQSLSLSPFPWAGHLCKEQ